MMVKKLSVPSSRQQQNVFDLANFPVTETIKMLTCLLEKIITANDSLIIEGKEKEIITKSTCFQSRTKPSIDIYDYLTRILKYCPCTNECFLSLLVYFDCMSMQHHLRINSFNIHRLIISGVMISSKFFSDVFFTNARYAKVGGLPVKELNLLELQFLSINNFNIYISLEELQQYGNQLLMHSIREREKHLLEYQQHIQKQQQKDILLQEPSINDNNQLYQTQFDT
ncbi:unnamed protein product [Mucor hiemalis]